MARGLGADADDQPPGRRRPLPARRVAFPRPRRGRPDRQCREPRRPSAATAPSTGIMRRPRPRWSAMTKTIAAGLCGRRASWLSRSPRLHRVGDDRGISARAAGRERRSSPTSRSAGWRPPTKWPKSSAGWRSTLRRRRPAGSSTSTGQLCSLAPSSRWRGAACRSLFRSASRRPGRAARADREQRPALWRRLQGIGRLGQAGAAGPDPRQHLSRRHLRDFRDPDHREPAIS